jgi:hypothetical protein
MAAAATFEAIDANHDGVITQQEFAAAVGGEVVQEAPVIMQEVQYVQPATYVIEPQPATYVIEPSPMTYLAPESYVTYDPSAPVYYMAGAETTTPALVLTMGTRVVYTSRSNGQKYPATVLERSPIGWFLQLDIDGGLKEVEDAEIWRVEYEGVETVEETPAAPAKAVKSKKVKKNSKKGCC